MENGKKLIDGTFLLEIEQKLIKFFTPFKLNLAEIEFVLKHSLESLLLLIDDQKKVAFKKAKINTAIDIFKKEGV